MSKNINFNGKLELNENNEYIVNSKNLSEELYNNWKNEIPATYSLFVDGKEFRSEECVLQKRKYKGMLYDYFVEDVDLDNKLFKAVGKHIDFNIERNKKYGIHKS